MAKPGKQEQVGPEDLPASERGDAAQDAVAAVAVEEAAKAAAAAPEDETGGDSRKFSRDRVLTESDQIAGVPAHVVAGALAGDDREDLTVAQIKRAVEKYQGHEATTTETGE
jgi:hypothetical protein